MKIHCPEVAAEMLKWQASDLKLEWRGMIPIKGKGEMETFFIHHGLKFGVLRQSKYGGGAQHRKDYYKLQRKVVSFDPPMRFDPSSVKCSIKQTLSAKQTAALREDKVVSLYER